MVGESSDQSVFSEDKVSLFLTGIGFIILSLTLLQLCLVLAAYYPQLKYYQFIGISMFAIVLGMAECRIIKNNYKVPGTFRVLTGGSLILIAYFVFPKILVSQFFISLGSIIAVYLLSYNLTSIIKEMEFDRENKTEINKNYQRNMSQFNDLKKLTFMIDILVITSWLFARGISRGMVLVGSLIFFLQFVLLGIAYYQKKRIAWELEKRKISPDLLRQMISWILVLALIVSAVSVFLPVDYSSFWNNVKEKIIQLMDGQKLDLWVKPPAQRGNQEGNPVPKPNIEDDGELPWYLLLFIGILIAGVSLIMIGFCFVIIRGLWEYFKTEKKKLRYLPEIIKKVAKEFIKLITSWTEIFTKGTKELRKSFNFNQSSREELERKLAKEDSSLKRSLNPEVPEEKIVLLFLQVREKFKEQGIYYKETQTIEEYLQAAVKKFTSFKSQILTIKIILEEAIYSRHSLTEDEVSKMAAAVEEVKKIH